MNKGTVIKSTGRDCIVKSDSGEIFLCHAKGTLRTGGFRATNPLAVGDKVEYTPPPLPPAGGERQPGLVTQILPRKNYIIRKAIKKSSEVQVIAANIDQMLLVASLASPKTLTGFIDRVLVTAEAYSIPSAILFNKADLYNEEEKDELAGLMAAYTDAGYRCLFSSLTKNIGIDKIKNILKEKTTLLAGNSGVGKTTLINLIQPELDLKTMEISSAHSLGQHVTTFGEMFELSSGGKIIDTPGLKSFGIVDFYRRELFHYFPEIFRLSASCKFNDCTHTSEPKCAVKAAVENGEIAEFRYNNYLKIFNGEDLIIEYDD